MEPVSGPEPAAPTEPEPEPEPAPEPEPEATLDLDSLENRLRKTDAIGLFTKLEIKSQVEDLVDEVGEYHSGNGRLTLGTLEERFNLLVLKLLTLLQEDDPELHHQIANARPALWRTLSDPVSFAAVRG